MPTSRTISWHLLVCLAAAGCGPGQIANSGGELGSGVATETGFEPDPGTGPDESSEPPSPSTTGPDWGDITGEEPDPDAGDETETGFDDWGEPEPDPDPEPLPVGDCSLTWLAVDTSESHGHIGSTPIGPGPEGGFVSVNPVLVGPQPGIVDARIRRWTPAGEVVWDREISWAELRDDPLAVTTDELGDVVLGGRTNANTLDEDALVAKLDGATGDPLWVWRRGEPGGYSAITSFGPTVVAAGTIGELGLEVVVLDSDTGALLWSATPLPGQSAQVGGVEVLAGSVYLLLNHSGFEGELLELVRLEPPSETLGSVIVLGSGDSVVGLDLDRFGADELVVVWQELTNTGLARIPLDDPEGLFAHIWAPFPAGETRAREIVELGYGQGLAIAGTLVLGEVGHSFVMRFDDQLEPLCTGLLSEVQVGSSSTPQLRGLAAGPGGALYTGSFVGNDRVGAFARWD